MGASHGFTFATRVDMVLLGRRRVEWRKEDKTEKRLTELTELTELSGESGRCGRKAVT